MNNVKISPGEDVLLNIRYHPIVLLPVLVSTLVLYIASLVGFYLLGRYSYLVAPVIPIPVASILLVLLLTLVTLIIVLSIYVFSRSSLILTNENLIQVKQIGLFNRKVSVLSLSHIEDVTGHSKGVMATVLGFGDINVETAGEQHNFVFSPVSNPYPIVELINRTHQEFEHKTAKTK